MKTCLTFDDGLPCHFKTVIPELNARGMKGTFFVPIIPIDGSTGAIFDVKFREEVWKSALADGHEIGGHSVYHRKLRDTPTGEIAESQSVLRETLGVEPRSYAWPFCETITFHEQASGRYYDQARGGPEGRGQWNYPSIVIGDWNVAPAIASPQKRVYTFHGVGQDGAWGNITLDQFRRFLDAVGTSVTFAQYFKEKL